MATHGLAYESSRGHCSLGPVIIQQNSPGQTFGYAWRYVSSPLEVCDDAHVPVDDCGQLRHPVTSDCPIRLMFNVLFVRNI